jgi:hypothetical protein
MLGRKISKEILRILWIVLEVTAVMKLVEVLHIIFLSQISLILLHQIN